jgi:hypothetical protein
LQRALEEARPHREQAAALFAQAQALETDWREKRKARTVAEARLAELEEKWKALEREAREALAKGEAIEDAAYDLKAVNPNRTSYEDTRTRAQLLSFIADKGREADAAVARLRQMVTGPQSRAC